MRLRHLLIAAVLVAVATPTAAQSSDDASPDPFALQVHAFVSQGFMLSTQNDYLAHSKRGNAEFTEAGINFTKQLTNELRLGMQLFTRDLGDVGNYSVKLDWFYLDYRVNDWFGFRAGRVKLPFGLYNEVSDIDQARVPILLPQSIYPITSRDYLLAQTGAELYGRIPLGAGGALDYRAYAGTIFLEADVKASDPVQIDDINVPYVAGGRLLWETPLEGLRAGGSLQALRLEGDLVFDASRWTSMQMDGSLPADFDGKVTMELPVVLWIASIEYAAHDWLVSAEYSRWNVDVHSTQPSLLPETGPTSERGFVMAAYRVTNWFVPGAYYSLLYRDTAHRDGRDAKQHDIALTLRFDINPYWLVKLEGHYMYGTAALNKALNDGRPLDELARNWQFFLVKTTAYF